MRAVRISAAHYYNVVDKSQVEQLEEFKVANKEYMTELDVNSDLPAGLHQLGVYYQSIGDIRQGTGILSRKQLRKITILICLV